jgi:hypothetical protein
MGEVVNLNQFRKDYNKDRYAVFAFSWGAATKDMKKDKWLTIVFDAETALDVSERDVVIDDGGIRFIKNKRRN